jgi:hypothetical protein
MGDEGWRLVDHQMKGLLPIVLEDWDSMMTTREYLSWIPMDEFLVESLGLTKACDIFQSYSDPNLCRNTMKYKNTHKHRDAAEIRLHFINNK